MADLVGGITLALVSDWATTLTLIFGGCCSNALTLEQLTSQYPKAGSLITFSQFLLITINGLRKFVVWTPYPRLKPRRIPLLPYIIQVALFYLVSYLNNAAFAYKIPMTVHIIFRSGGLVISMILGWLLQSKRYKLSQVASVVLVTAGVMMTTLSASKPKATPLNSLSSDSTILDPHHTRTYLTGIGILTLALVLSGLLGIAQDRTYAKYGRQIPKSMQKEVKTETQKKAAAPIEPWQESMFYLHFLSLPMFVFSWKDLLAQVSMLSSGPTLQFVLSEPLQAAATTLAPSFFQSRNTSLPPSTTFSISLPSPYISLVLNTLTQLVCVSGVHRLTSRVSSLTVTLILVVRKAVSLIISVLLFGDSLNAQSRWMMWGGAASVFIGTMLYSVASAGTKGKDDKSNDKEKKE
ncbi:UAA transporter [Irpex rosettiformis]|uniref:UAA transporter n=1 Tax=Irpex rosettiformis TaxID=378272 RepID=A0ACB8UEA0_9APHY|nr:UAA transporter [Irpex rosettiformis]